MSRKQGHSYLFILDNLELGGIQRQLYEVCLDLKRGGDRCVVACFRAFPDAMVSQYKNSGIPVMFLKKRRLIDLKFILRLRNLVKKGNFDLIHCMTPQASFWAGCVLPFNTRTLLIGSLLNTYKLDSLLDRICERIISASRMDGIFINSGAGVKYYKQKISHCPRIWLIYNGVKIISTKQKGVLRKEIGIKDDEIAVVAMGRLERVKRHKDAIEALNMLLPGKENIRLYIIGNGNSRDELETYARSLGMKNSVVFLGERMNAQEILPAFDIFMMTSKSEGMPNALLEAMASGIPCIATRVGGIPEIINHGENGILVEPGNVYQIKEALAELVQSPMKRKSLGEAGKKVVHERFPMEKMKRRMISHYEEALKKTNYDMAYIFSLFPKLSEAFLLREITQMRKRGISCCVVSLKSPREKIIHKQARAIINDVLYLPWFSGRIFLENLLLFIKSPTLYMRSFGEFIFLHKAFPKEMFKAFCVWWKTVGFAAKLRKAGIVHIHGNWATIPTACAMAMARLLGRSYSFTGHAFDIYALPTSLKEKIQKAEFVITCTERNRKYLRSLAPEPFKENIHLVRHFIAPPKNIVKNRIQPPLILSVGALENYKGHHHLIEAAFLLHKKGLNFQVRIIGRGPCRNRLEGIIKNLKLESRVKLMGGMPQEKVFEQYAKATLFALASVKNIRSDNLPNVLVEASLLKVPCIASNIGSIKEFIIHEKTGFLFESGNITDLSGKMETLLVREDLQEAFGANARKKALEMFSPERNAPLLEALLKDSIKKQKTVRK